MQIARLPSYDGRRRICCVLLSSDVSTAGQSPPARPLPQQRRAQLLSRAIDLWRTLLAPSNCLVSPARNTGPGESQHHASCEIGYDVLTERRMASTASLVQPDIKDKKLSAQRPRLSGH